MSDIIFSCSYLGTLFRYLIRLLIASLLCAVADTKASVGSWSPAGSLAAPRRFATATLLGDGKVLVTGGQTNGDPAVASVELYAPANNTWSSAGSLTTARTLHTATLLSNGKVLVTGGKNSGNYAFFTALSSAELYDPVSNNWLSAGSLSSARFSHTATLLVNGKVLVYGGGNNSNIPLGSAELYDPASNTWSVAGQATARYSHFTATLLSNGKVLVAGGDTPFKSLSQAELYNPASNTWSPATPMPSARFGHAATLLANGKVLVTGGIESNGALAVSSADLYDPASNTWFPAAPMQAARISHTATLLTTGEVLVAGNQFGTTAAEVYDPVTNTWSGAGATRGLAGRASRYPTTATLLCNGTVLIVVSGLSNAVLYDPFKTNWSSAGSTFSARFGHTMTRLANGTVLVAGGVDGFTYLSSAELYDPAINSWFAAASMPQERTLHTATLLSDGKVLVVGGFGFGGSGSALSSALLYDPVNNSWSSAGSMPTDRLHSERYNHTATLLSDGKVLVVGGANRAAWTSTAALYDPVSNTWSKAAPMATPRLYHTATLLSDGKVLVSGGKDFPTTLSTAELYNVASNTWSPATPMATARYSHAAVLLSNGKVLVVGGSQETLSDKLSSAELYDPVSNTWFPAGSLLEGRSDHTATFLGDGTVLVTGGEVRYGGEKFLLCTAELYDPASNAWSATGSLAEARYAHKEALLTDGRVLVTGGDGYLSWLSSGELYDPSSVRTDTVTDVADVNPDPRTNVVSSVDVAFSAPINPATFTVTNLSFSHDSNTVALTSVVTINLVPGSAYYRVSGLDSFTSAEGRYVLTVNASGIQDAAGALFTGSVSEAWVVDTSAPARPSVTGITTDTGASPTDGVTSDSTLVISGTAEPNTLVAVLKDGTRIGVAGANSSGAWSFNYTGNALTPGTYTLIAQATDLAGNTSLDSAAFPVVVDTTAPARPAILEITTDTGASPTDGVTSDTTLVISGTAEARSTVTLFPTWFSANIGSAVADDSGIWSFDYTGTTLSEGEHVFIARATDLAGNVSADSAWFLVTIDTLPAFAPAITRITTDTGANAGDRVTSDPTLVIFGESRGESTVTVLRDDAMIGTTSTDVFGSWSFDYTGTTLPAGTYQFKARVTDLAGNVADSAVFTVVVDTSSPAAPAVTGITTDTGASAADGVTSDRTLMIFGTAEAGSTVTVLRGMTSIGAVTANASGAWSFDYTGASLPAGTYQFKARAMDLAGNVSRDSVVFTVVVVDDGTSSLSINDATVTEGNSGMVNAGFTVRLSSASDQTVTVNYAAASGTATDPGDYTASSGNLSFAPGDISKTITVPVEGDLLDEPNETFLVNLSGAVNATIGDAQGLGTIVDNDEPPSLSINDNSVPEGNSGTVIAAYTVSLWPASGRTVTVNYTTSDGTATVADNDYISTNAVFTFLPGETQKTITVWVVGDSIVESNEVFYVNLSNPTNAAIGRTQAIGTVVDDDSASVLPTLQIKQLLGGTFGLTWTAESQGFQVEITYSLSPPIHWSAITNQPVLGNGQFSVALPVTSTDSFYRLIKPVSN